MSTIIWSEPARDDLIEIGRYWWPLAPGYAERLGHDLEASAAFLARLPNAGPETDTPHVRKWRLKGHGYIIFYRPRDEGVEILRIRHGRENWRAAP